VQSIAMNVSLCLSVCLSCLLACLKKHSSRLPENSVLVNYGRPLVSPDDSVVLLVLWMTLCLHIMGQAKVTTHQGQHQEWSLLPTIALLR